MFPLPFLLAAVHVHNLYFAAPLIIVVSLVYSATRNEHMTPILHGALRVGIWITGFMLLIFAILWYVSSLV